MAFYVLCDDDCRHLALTKEETLAAIEAALENGYVSDPDAAVISKLREIRASGSVQFWVGTEAQFNALDPVPDIGRSVVRVGSDGILYLCTDDSSLNIHFPLAVEMGGTGAVNAADACRNLGTAQIIYAVDEPPYQEGAIWIQPIEE